ncbi:helix-turn-helix domain-containing protein [Flavobacterium sp. ZT3R17]|uniref:helix-turn-helix domain-containing protein n=1 Tax=Flavobacterium cryoconiti TaxID=3398736 RepID=UPI003A8AA9F9
MLTNLLFIITGLIGLLTITLIYNNYESNKIMNFYIVLLIIIMSLRFFLNGLTYFVSDSSFKNIYFTYSNFSSVVIPLCYLYFKNLFANEKAFNTMELYHFIFPLSFSILGIILNTQSFPIPGLKLFLYAVFISFVVFYNVLSYRILKNNIWSKKGVVKVIMKQNKVINNWASFLLIALVLISIRLITALFIDLYYNQSMKGFNYQWISSCIWLLILIKILITPEILYGYNALNKKINENKKTDLVLNEIWKIAPNINLNNSQHSILKEKIDKNILIYIDHIEKLSFEYETFRDSKMTLTDFSNKLNIPKSHISYIFKYHSTISFSEYKKVIRIHDAIKHIELNYLKNNTLDSLSKKVGFTSYNPFFTSFKEISGVSPLEYYKMVKVEFNE